MIQPKPLYNAAQFREWDAETIVDRACTSAELMEIAAEAFVQHFVPLFPDRNTPLCIAAGKGNNGGDALAIARLLLRVDYKKIQLMLPLSELNLCSIDFGINYKRLPKVEEISLHDLYFSDFSQFDDGKHILIDGILGTGFTPPLHDKVVNAINSLNSIEWKSVVSIDLPSGLETDKSGQTGPCIRADHTFTFQQYKRALLFKSNSHFFGKVHIVDIGLSKTFHRPGNTYLLDKDYVQSLYRPIPLFAHKYDLGLLSILSGSKQFPGAAILTCMGALAAGTGLVELHPGSKDFSHNVIQVIPEVILRDNASIHEKTSAFVVGPGLNTKKYTITKIQQIINSGLPGVIDATAFNFLFESGEKLPSNCVFTPHPGEFERAFGKQENEDLSLELLSHLAVEHQSVFILKGNHTAVACPDGTVFFNTTGNEALAKGGTGDVLAGFIGGWLAKGYGLKEAAILGVYLHGLAADIFLQHFSQETLRASILSEYIGKAIRKLMSN